MAGQPDASPLAELLGDDDIGVMFFDDPVAAFRNVRAALRPGGRLAFLCWQNALDNEVFSVPLRALREHGWLPEDAADGIWGEAAAYLVTARRPLTG